MMQLSFPANLTVGKLRRGRGAGSYHIRRTGTLVVFVLGLKGSFCTSYCSLSKDPTSEAFSVSAVTAIEPTNVSVA